MLGVDKTVTACNRVGNTLEHVGVQWHNAIDHNGSGTKVQYNAQDTTQCWSLPAEDYAPSVQTGELEIMMSGLADL